MFKNSVFALSLICSVTTCSGNANPLDHFKPNKCLTQVNDKVIDYGDVKFLVMDYCMLNDEDISSLRIYLNEHKDISVLSLSHNSIGPKGAAQLAQISSITYLDISKNPIGSEGALALANNTTLENINALDSGIGDEGAIALANNSQLKGLVLLNNPIGNDGFLALAKSTTLSTLWIGDLSTIAYESIAALEQNQKLSTLGIYYSNLGVNEASLIARMPNLTSLAMGYSNLGDEGAIALAANERINYIDLSNANLSSRGAAAIAAMTGLEFVQLGNYDEVGFPRVLNHIDDHGAEALASNSHLTSIVLRGNQISNEGAIALSKNATINILMLAHNNISDSGAVALAQNTTLWYLDVAYNHIGAAGIEALLQNTSIANIWFEGNPGSEHSGLIKRKLDVFEQITKMHCLAYDKVFCRIPFTSKSLI